MKHTKHIQTMSMTLLHGSERSEIPLEYLILKALKISKAHPLADANSEPIRLRLSIRRKTSVARQQRCITRP